MRACLTSPRAIASTRNEVAESPLAQERPNVFTVRNLFRQYGVVGGKNEIAVLSVKLKPAVARGIVPDLDEDMRRHRVFREALEGRDDALSFQARGASVPNRQRSDAVGVDVLRSP